MVMCVSIPLDLALPSKKQAHWWCSLCQQQVLASIMHPSLPAFGGAMLVVNPAACGQFMTVMGLKTSKCNHLAAHLPSHLYSFAGSWTSQLWHCWGSDLDNKPTVTFLDRCYIANHFQQMQRQKTKTFQVTNCITVHEGSIHLPHADLQVQSGPPPLNQMCSDPERYNCQWWSFKSMQRILEAPILAFWNPPKVTSLQMIHQRSRACTHNYIQMHTSLPLIYSYNIFAMN